MDRQIPNTFGLKVKARHWLEYCSEEELETWIREGRITSPYFHIGGGSNLLFLNDYEGTILHSAIRDMEILSEDDAKVLVRVGAGIVWDDFVAICVERGWYGVENLSGIPGEVGASAVQNIGAYGVEVKDLIYQVETFNMNGEKKVYEAGQCEYAYRDSLFKKQEMKHVFVTYVRFCLSKQEHYSLGYGTLLQEVQAQGRCDLRTIRETVLAVRNRKLPDPGQLGNAGSFFKNPLVPQAQFDSLLQIYPNMPHYPAGEGLVKLPAGWLIEQCGWKGKNQGAAGVYEKQALVLVNRGGADGREIMALAQAVQASVYRKFGVRISPEVNVIA